MEPMLVHRSSVVSISRRRKAGLVACSVDGLVTSKHSIDFEIFCISVYVYKSSSVLWHLLLFLIVVQHFTMAANHTHSKEAMQCFPQRGVPGCSPLFPNLVFFDVVIGMFYLRKNYILLLSFFFNLGETLGNGNASHHAVLKQSLSPKKVATDAAATVDEELG